MCHCTVYLTVNISRFLLKECIHCLFIEILVKLPIIYLKRLTESVRNLIVSLLDQYPNLGPPVNHRIVVVNFCVIGSGRGGTRNYFYFVGDVRFPRWFSANVNVVSV
jgi:hypothetical protein